MGRLQHSNAPAGGGLHKRGGGIVSTPPSPQHSTNTATTASSSPSGPSSTQPVSALSLEYIDFAALVEEVQGNVVSEKRLLPRSWFGRMVLCILVTLSLMLLKETAFRNTRLESADITMHINIQEACRRSNSLLSEECQAHQYNLARKASFGASAYEKVHEALYGKIAPVHALVLPVFILYIHLAGSGKTLAVPRKQAVGVFPTIIGMMRGGLVAAVTGGGWSSGGGDSGNGGPAPLVGPSTLPLAMSTSTWLPPVRGSVDWQDTIYNSDLTTHIVAAADGDFGCTRTAFLLEQIVFGHSIACLLIHFVSTANVPDVSLCCLLAAARLFTSQASLSSWFNSSNNDRSGHKRNGRSTRRPQVSAKNIIEWIVWATLFAFLFFPHADSPSKDSTPDANFRVGDGEGVDSAKVLGSEQAASLYAGGLKVASRQDAPPAPNNRYAFHWALIHARLPLVPIIVPTNLLEYAMGLFGRNRRPLNTLSATTSDRDSLLAANEVIMEKYYPSVRLVSPCGPALFTTFQKHIVGLSDGKAFQRAEKDPRLVSPLSRASMAFYSNYRFGSNAAKATRSSKTAQPIAEVEAALGACSPHLGGSPPQLLQEFFVVDEWQSTTIWAAMLWYSLTFSIVYCIRMSGIAVDSRAWLATAVQHNCFRGATRLLHWMLSTVYTSNNTTTPRKGKNGGSHPHSSNNNNKQSPSSSSSLTVTTTLRALVWGTLQLLILFCTLIPTILVRIGLPVALYMYICAIENGLAIPWPTSSMVMLANNKERVNSYGGTIESLIYPRVTALGGAIPLAKLLSMVMVAYGFGAMQFINDGISVTTSYAAIRKLCAVASNAESVMVYHPTRGPIATFVTQHPCSILALFHYGIVLTIALAIFLCGLLVPSFNDVVSPVGSLGVDLMVGHMISSRLVGLIDYAIVSLIGTDVWWAYSSSTGQKHTAPHATAPRPSLKTICLSWLSWSIRVMVLAALYVSGFVFVIAAHYPATYFIVPFSRADIHATQTQRILKTIPDSLCAAASLLFVVGLFSRFLVRLVYWRSLRIQERANLPNRIAEAESAAAQLQHREQQAAEQAAQREEAAADAIAAAAAQQPAVSTPPSEVETTSTTVVAESTTSTLQQHPTTKEVATHHHHQQDEEIPQQSTTTTTTTTSPPPPLHPSSAVEVESVDSTPSTTPTSINGSYRKQEAAEIEATAAASSSTPTPVPEAVTATTPTTTSVDEIPNSSSSAAVSSASLINGKKKRRQERKEAAERERILEETRKEQEKAERLEHQRLTKERKERERKLEEEEAEEVRRVEEEKRHREEIVRRAEEEQRREEEEFKKKQQEAKQQKGGGTAKNIPKPLPATAAEKIELQQQHATTTPQSSNSSRFPPMSIDEDAAENTTTTKQPPSSTTTATATHHRGPTDVDSKVTVAIPLPASKNKQRQEALNSHKQQQPSNNNNKAPTAQPPRPMFEEEDFSAGMAAEGASAAISPSSPTPSKKKLDPVSAAIAGVWGNKAITTSSASKPTISATSPPAPADSNFDVVKSALPTTANQQKGGVGTASYRDATSSTPVATTSPSLNHNVPSAGTSPLRKPTAAEPTGTRVLPPMAPLPAGQRSYASALISTKKTEPVSATGGATPPLLNSGFGVDSSSFCSNPVGGSSFTLVSAKERIRNGGSASTNNYPLPTATTNQSSKTSASGYSPNRGPIKSGSFRFAPGALGASSGDDDEQNDEADGLPFYPADDGEDDDMLPQLPRLNSKPQGGMTSYKKQQQQRASTTTTASSSTPTPSKRSSGIVPIGNGPATIDDGDDDINNNHHGGSNITDTFDGLPGLPPPAYTAPYSDSRHNNNNQQLQQKRNSNNWLVVPAASGGIEGRNRSVSSYSAGSGKTQDEPIISIQVVDEVQLGNTFGHQSGGASTINPSSPTTLHQQFDDLLVPFPTNHSNDAIDNEIGSDPQYTPFATPERVGGGLPDPFGHIGAIGLNQQLQQPPPTMQTSALEPAMMRMEMSMSSDDSLSSALFADVQGDDDDDDLPTDIWGTGGAAAAPRNAVYNHHEAIPPRRMVAEEDDDGFVVESGGGASVVQPPTLQASAAEFLPRGFESPGPQQVIGSNMLSHHHHHHLQLQQQALTPPTQYRGSLLPQQQHIQQQPQAQLVSNVSSSSSLQQQQPHVVEQKLVYLQNATTGEQQPRLMVTYSNGQTAFHPVVFTPATSPSQPTATSPFYPSTTPTSAGPQSIHLDQQYAALPPQHHHQAHQPSSNGAPLHHHLPHVAVPPAYPEYAPQSASVSPEARNRNNNNNRRPVITLSHGGGGGAMSAAAAHPPTPSSQPQPSLRRQASHHQHNPSPSPNVVPVLSNQFSFNRDEMGAALTQPSPEVTVGDSGRDSVLSIVVGTPGHQSYQRTVSNNPHNSNHLIPSGTSSPAAHSSPQMSRTQSVSSPTHHQIKVAGKIVNIVQGPYPTKE